MMAPKRIPARLVQAEDTLASLAVPNTNNLAVMLHLAGALAPGTCERAVSELVERHEALRTTLHVEGEDVEQQIWPPAPLAVAAGDATAERLEADLIAFVNEGVQLDGGPLVAARLLRLDEREHVLVLRVNHMMADAWSTRLLMAELRELLAAHNAGRPSALAPPSAQFSDFVEHERSASTERTHAWWRRHAIPRPSRVAELVGPHVEGRAAMLSAPIAPPSAPLLAALDELTVPSNISRATTMLAVAAACAYRCGDDDVIVGVSHANRYRLEHFGIVGMLADMQPVPIDLGGELTFRALLERVHHAWLGALEHQLPWLAVADVIGFDPEEAGRPLCDVWLNYIPNGLAGTAAGNGTVPDGGLTIEPLFMRWETHEATTERKSEHSFWGLTFFEDVDGVPHGFATTRAGSATIEQLTALGDGVLDLLLRATTEPDRPLREL